MMYNNYPQYPYPAYRDPQFQTQPQYSQVPQTPTVPQSKGQTIRNLSQTQMDTQSECYFVNNKTEMQSIQPEYGTVYIGINTTAKEIYTRSWNDNGSIDFKTYTLSERGEEDSELKTIMKKLTKIEEKLNERNTTNATTTSNVRTTPKSSFDGDF